MSDRAIIKDVDMSEEMAEVRFACARNLQRNCCQAAPRYLASAVSSFPFLLPFQCALHYAWPRCHTLQLSGHVSNRTRSHRQVQRPAGGRVHNQENVRPEVLPNMVRPRWADLFVAIFLRFKYFSCLF